MVDEAKEYVYKQKMVLWLNYADWIIQRIDIKYDRRKNALKLL